MNILRSLLLSSELIMPAFSQGASSQNINNDTIIELVNAGVSEQIIIQTIQNSTNREFDLTPTGLISLKKAKVPDGVILAMQGTDKPDPIQQSIINGETIVRPIKLMGVGNANFYEGTLSISKSYIVLRIPGSNYGFNIPPNQLFTIEVKNFQLHLTFNIVDALGRTSSGSYYLSDPKARLDRGGIDLSACDDYMDKLAKLLQFVKKLK